MNDQPAQNLPALWTTEAKLVLGFGVVFAILATIFLSIYTNSQTVVELEKSTDRTYEMVAELRMLHALILEAESGCRGFLLSGEHRFEQQYNQSVSQIPPHLQ